MQNIVFVTGYGPTLIKNTVLSKSHDFLNNAHIQNLQILLVSL